MDLIVNLLITILVIVAIYVFMVAPRMLNRADRTAFKNRHYAHRGLFDNNSDAPENSLAAFKKAVDAGYGIELDVQLSKDDKLVVFHDATLNRMCGIDGKVWDYTLEELQQMKLLNSNETIPTFEQFLEVVDGKVPFILEYKLDRVQTRVCELANEVLKNYKGVYCIESFHPLALLWYRKNRPDVLRGQLCEEFFRAFVRESGVTLHIRQLSGTNSHHIIEGTFKAVARVLSKGVSIDEKYKDEIPSTKGVI